MMFYYDLVTNEHFDCVVSGPPVSVQRAQRCQVQDRLQCSQYMYRPTLARTMLSQDVCLSVRLSVCPSVTRRYSMETAKLLSKLFFTVGSHTILVFLYQTVWQYCDRDADP